MSYLRIQQILEADPMFASRVSVKDAEVALRNGEKTPMSSIIVGVHAALKTAGCNMQSVAKTMVLATAARFLQGEPVPEVPVPALSAPEPEAPKAIVSRMKAAGDAPAPKTPQSTTKPVVITTSRPGAPRPLSVEKQADVEVVQRYQCAVASAQLLAALHQLFEKDDFAGHEDRKKKLDELIDMVEKSSSHHVNISVKAILRSKAASKAAA